MTGHLAEMRARRLAEQLAGRSFPSLEDLHRAAAALGWQRSTVDNALSVLTDRGELHEDPFGGLVIRGDVAPEHASPDEGTPLA